MEVVTEARSLLVGPSASIAWPMSAGRTSDLSRPAASPADDLVESSVEDRVKMTSCSSPRGWPWKVKQARRQIRRMHWAIKGMILTSGRNDPLVRLHICRRIAANGPVEGRLPAYGAAVAEMARSAAHLCCICLTD